DRNSNPQRLCNYSEKYSHSYLSRMRGSIHEKPRRIGERSLHNEVHYVFSAAWFTGATKLFRPPPLRKSPDKPQIQQDHPNWQSRRRDIRNARFPLIESIVQGLSRPSLICIANPLEPVGRDPESVDMLEPDPDS